MTNLIVALLTLSGIIAGTAALAQGALGPQLDVADAVKFVREVSGTVAGTEMSAILVDVTDGGLGISMTVRNDGETSLRVTEDWDLILAYDSSPSSTGLEVIHLTYTTSASLGNDEWLVEGIYLDASESEAEEFGRDILDSSEEMIINAKLATAISTPSTNSLALSTDSGVTMSVQFTN